MGNAATADVLGGRAPWSCACGGALGFLGSLPEQSVSLVLFSPPYEDKRTYGVGFKLKGQAWVDWLRPIVVAACRASAGLVAVNAAGKSHRNRYSPVMEWLVADLTRQDGIVCGPAPYAWVRSGVMGSGGPRYHRRNWEPVYCFCLPDRLPLAWSDNTAFGKPPKCKAGGAPTNRQPSGVRVKYRPGMKGRNKPYRAPEIANPGNVIRTKNGGGQLGHELAHENEAPMNIEIPRRFVAWFAPPGSIVCDPFSGSGTTCHAAVESGRRFVGCDLRQNQVELVERRMAGVTPSLFGAA